MSLRPLPGARFIRRTELRPDEYRKNFHQIDREVLSAVTSEEADRVTPLMSKIYLRMVNAPEKYWERDGVLRIEAEVRDEGLVKAWSVLCELVGVASATASKALRWMHEQGIIGYFSGKNGVGLRIFLNRAASSVGIRQGQAGKKILAFAPASSVAFPASANEPAFMDSFAVKEISDTDRNPRAPKSGAEQTGVAKTDPDSHPARSEHFPRGDGSESMPPPRPALRFEVPVAEIVSRLKHELEPSLQSAARRAAAQEHERTREWLESRGLPKAARVAQREAYNVLRKYGVIRDTTHAASADIGRGQPTQELQPLMDGEVEELAQACVAMLEVKGQSVEVTLSEMSTEAGGFLLPADAPRVRSKVEALLNGR